MSGYYHQSRSGRGRVNNNRSHRNNSGNRTNNMFVRQKEEVEMEYRMQEWGARRELPDPKHREFWNAQLKHVRDVLSGKYVEALEPDLPQTLPRDPMDAIREVMLQELGAQNKEKGLTKVTDRLAERYPGCPSHPPYKYNRPKRRYMLRQEFKEAGISEDLLVPFVRFEYERVPALPRSRSRICLRRKHLRVPCHRGAPLDAWP